MKKQNRPKLAQSVFVVCNPGSDIRLLIATLRDLGLHPLNGEDAFGTSDRVVTNTLGLIATADLACVVLQAEINSNVLFEVGYAIGAGLPVVLIGDPTHVPSEIANQFTIRAPISDTRAVAFQLRAFLDNLKRSKRKAGDVAARMTRQPKPSAKLVSSPGHQGDVEEQRLLEALQTSPEIGAIVAQPQTPNIEEASKNYIPDFAVWFTEAPETIGSQAIIEVKGSQMSNAAMERAIEQIRSYAYNAEIRTGFVLTAAAKQTRGPVVNLSPLVFMYPLTEFYAMLRSGKLIETLRRERNRFAHSAG